MHVYIEDDFIIQIIVLTDEALTVETSEEFLINNLTICLKKSFSLVKINQPTDMYIYTGCPKKTIHVT